MSYNPLEESPTPKRKTKSGKSTQLKVRNSSGKNRQSLTPGNDKRNYKSEDEESKDDN